jgi:signal peptidase II
LTAVIIILDQITKAIIVMNVEPIYEQGFRINVIGEFFRIIHARNPGIAFSIGHQLPDGLRSVLFVILPLGVLVALVVFYFRSDEFTGTQRWCIAGIIGGGIGNLIDRIFRPEGVVDFLDFRFYGIFGLERWPTFNVADATVVVSSILLLVTLVFEDTGETGNEQEG